MSKEAWIGVFIGGFLSFLVGLYFYLRQKSDTKKEKAKEEQKRGGMKLSDINYSIPSTRKQSLPSTSGSSTSSSGVSRIAAKIVEDLARQTDNRVPESVSFKITSKYKGYRTELMYKNNSNVCARNVKVIVVQDENEKLSETVIVNEKQFPIAFLMPGDWFYVDVDCYYPKTYREFHVQWDDETGEHDEKNMLLLSKNYVV